jgi:hypothetical protein
LVAAERLIGMAGDGFADVAAEQQAGEKPAEILFILASREVETQLFGKKPGLFELAKVGHRPIFSWHAVQPDA